jgi:hypothetical protein
MERKGPGFFRRRPQAFFIDSIQQASRGKRTVPDWFQELQKEEMARHAEGCKDKLLASPDEYLAKLKR